MRDYILFLDTEASGLPKTWDQPYSNSDNWPFSVQIAWVIFSGDALLIKKENHFIGDDDFEIHPSAIKIHGITREYLNKCGESRKAVMQKLADDLEFYKPLVVGHFMEFDYHIASADFFRSAVPNALENLPTFCTMLGSSLYVRDPSMKYMRLGELYTVLFNKKLENQHNALVDAEATANCFFEMLCRGEITGEKVLSQATSKEEPLKAFKWIALSLVVIFIIILISYWL